MPDIKIFPIEAFSDNYIWCIQTNGHAVVVDPGDSVPVIKYLAEHNLILDDILITHHHWDHTNGLPELVKAFPGVNVYGPAHGSIGHLTHKLNEGDRVRLAKMDVEFEVLAVPGHTLDHIAYYGTLGLFSGDTLFSAGCGRLFEGTPKQMYHSLNKLKQLPDDTTVYCTHEYTLANIEFALAVEPHNTDLLGYKSWAEQQRAHLWPTLPTTIKQQKAVNPFLRSEVETVKMAAQQHMGKPISEADQVFAAIRDWKDNF